MATITPSYKFETWVGPLAGEDSGASTTQPWSLASTCTYITHAITTIYQNVSLVSSTFQTAVTSTEYRMNLTDWMTTNCLPTNWVPGTANYYYPGACPQEWTSWPTVTTITSTITAPSKPSSTTELVFTDMACCPHNYTAFWKNSDIFCTSSITLIDMSNFQVWNLWSTSGASISSSEVRSNGSPLRYMVRRNQNLTYIPIFVRSAAQMQADFTPTQTASISGLSYTGAGPPIETGNGAQGGEEAQKKTNLAVILGMTIPVSLLAVAMAVYICWYCSSRKRKERKDRKSAEGVLREGNLQSEEVVDHLTTKPELEGSRPERDTTYPVVERAELNGASNTARDAITNANELQTNGRGRREANPEEGVLELDEQVGRRGVAEAEIDGRERRQEHQN